YAKVAVITNISEDLLGSGGIITLADLAHLKALVAERVLPDGCVVLNADDPLVAGLAKRAPALPAYFSLSRDNVLIRQNLNENHLCGYLDNS
ncbi:MAG TPA: cyanophycin synthetase, partial [Firmicutes bacterium]|nr:cyanophycin synthetase [Bacillota bacterium]